MDPVRVLVVDDEEELTSAIVERLNLRGFAASGVVTGAEALAWLEENTCDVVLLDVKMPGLGGLEVIQRIKDSHPGLEVILLTGHGSAQDAQQGISLGAFDYLMKPVKIDTLTQLLVSAADRSEEESR